MGELLIAGGLLSKRILLGGDQVLQEDNVSVAFMLEGRCTIEYRLRQQLLMFTVVRGNVGYRLKLP